MSAWRVCNLLVLSSFGDGLTDLHTLLVVKRLVSIYTSCQGERMGSVRLSMQYHIVMY